MKDIPVHHLKHRVDSGLEIFHFESNHPRLDADTMDAHRDDHYMFFVMEEGRASLMIDFHEIAFSRGTLYYVLPGQVHHRLSNKMSGGWFLAVDTLLVPPDCRKIFENQLLLQQPYLLNDTQILQCQTMLNLLLEKYQENSESPFYLPVIYSLLQSFIGVAAGCYAESNKLSHKISRTTELSQHFKRLLLDNYVTVKSPSAYAEMLNVSESYLNESLKKTTGLSVSYWILNEVMLEAKRLLYYSEQNVKGIAHALGYDDHAYFSRLFKKAEGVTPLTFRVTYRK